VIDRNQLPNGAFEFVMIASARAKQLLQGCLPKVADEGKPVTVAQQEVITGAVEKVEG
jgi:DNA-directed RNA polymerase subunit K/omega